MKPLFNKCFTYTLNLIILDKAILFVGMDIIWIPEILSIPNTISHSRSQPGRSSWNTSRNLFTTTVDRRVDVFKSISLTLTR